MPIALLIAGSLLLAASLKGAEHDLGKAITADLTGPQSFLTWLAALVIIGMVGYIPTLRKASDYFLLLVLIVILFSDKGFFANISNFVQTGVSPSSQDVSPQPYPSGGSSNSSSSSSSSGGDSTLSTVGEVASIAALLL